MVGKRVAHYSIIEKLGEGGMGVVCKARDTHLDGFAECLVPLFVAFAFLAVAWLLVAVGLRRQVWVWNGSRPSDQRLGLSRKERMT